MNTAEQLLGGNHEHGLLYAVLIRPDLKSDAAIKIGFFGCNARGMPVARYWRRFPRALCSEVWKLHGATKADEKRLHQILRPYRAAGREWYAESVCEVLEATSGLWKPNEAIDAIAAAVAASPPSPAETGGDAGTLPTQDARHE